MTVDASWLWTIGLLMLAVGIIAGIFIAYRFVPNSERERKLQETLENERNVHRAYREQVNAHFAKTSDLFQSMTDNYRAVYQHLAQGANELCEIAQDTPQLDLPDTRLIDQPASGAKAGPAPTPTPPPPESVPTAAESGAGTSDDEAEMEANAGPGPLPSIGEAAEEDVKAEAPIKKAAVLH